MLQYLLWGKFLKEVRHFLTLMNLMQGDQERWQGWCQLSSWGNTQQCLVSCTNMEHLDAKKKILTCFKEIKLKMRSFQRPVLLTREAKQFLKSRIFSKLKGHIDTSPKEIVVNKVPNYLHYIQKDEELVHYFWKNKSQYMQYLMRLAVSLERTFLVSYHRFSAVMKNPEDIYLYRQ